MANPKTPNLGLNKIDRSSPTTTYFDLEKYIDQNADSVDEFAGRVNAAIEHAGERLDTMKRQDVVLNAGMQILNAQRRATFSLSGIKGRTLVNRLGRNGSLDSKTNLGEFQVDLFVETTDKVQGTGSIKVTLETGEVNGAGFIGSIDYLSGKYYIVVANVKNVNATNGYIGLAQPVVLSNLITDRTKWSTAFFRFNSATNHTSNLDFAVRGLGGQSVLFDAARIYEISKDAYDEIPNLTPEQVAEKYPYVDSVQPVRNPYAIRYGENLLPPFYEASFRTKESDIIGPYTYVQTAESTDAWTRLLVNVLPQTDYTLSFSTLNGKGKMAVFSADEQTILLNYGQGVRTFNSGNVTQLAVYISGLAGDVDTIINPMLNVGRTAKPFKPREDSMLALQTDLYADPLRGANADEVFEKDGQYFKLAKWKRVVLDETISGLGASSFTGFKVVAMNISGGLPSTDLVTKYDGKVLSQKTTAFTTGDMAALESDSRLRISISNTDSGWGDTNRQQIFDSVVAGRTAYQLTPAFGSVIAVNSVLLNGVPYNNWSLSGSIVTLEVAPPAGTHVTINYISGYTPTADEIKAYFMGWRMFDGNTNEAYTGTGIKSWNSIMHYGTPTYATTTLPTTAAPGFITPYQLVYQLATPTVEPIVSEGMLTFNEGDNQIEVGTGIVVRENAKPSKDNNNVWNIGNPVANSTSQGFKYKAKGIMSIYKNSIPDVRWTIAVTPQYGALAQIQNSLFDPSAAYSTTYLMLDKSPIVPFIGSYAANEKAMLEELTDVVQQNTTAVSVLMNKKADKDSPGWITPTLLNGWVNYGSNDAVAGFYKDSDGMVYIRGTVKSGVVGGPNEQCTVFILPPGYRPSNYIGFATVANNGTADVAGRLNVDDGGRVIAKTGGNTWFGINIPPFLAEK
ncbi:hypothetical protein P4H46_15495 [Paenibacillus glucanolyticus]|uniref:hypothetical protein n=1 Tax=Paenibacillus glucanolyticus TaxID=59843 RepID=UPI0030C8DB0B